MIRIKQLCIFVLSMATLVLTACGALTAPTSSTTNPSPATASNPVETTTASTASPIVAKHAKGEVTLDVPAARVVACSEETVDFLLTLGLQPVGFCSGRVEGAQAGAPFQQPHFFNKDLLGTPVFVGSSEEPSLEEIVKLKPDLILVSPIADHAYDKLSQIAPTMLLDTAASDYWTGTLPEVGKAVGREAQAQQYLRDFDSRSAELRTQLAPVAQRAPDILLLYSFAAADGTMVFNDRWSGAQQLTALGFNVVVPDGITMPPSGVAPVSPEVLRNVNADTILVIRPKNPDGSVNRYPIDDILDGLQGVRVVRQLIDPTRGSTAPLTDKLVMEEYARLLLTNEAR